MPTRPPLHLSLFPVLAAGMLGCRPIPDLDDVPVESATLVDLQLNSLAILGGPVGGDAVLEFTTPDGSIGALPVSVKGGKVGGVFEITGDISEDVDVDLDLSNADGPLTARDLMGTYDGGGWGVAVGLGAGGHALSNRHGVTMDLTHAALGVGVFVGYEWVRVAEGGNELGGNYDGGAYWVSATPNAPMNDEISGTGPTDYNEPTACEEAGCANSPVTPTLPLLLVALAAIRRRHTRVEAKQGAETPGKPGFRHPASLDFSGSTVVVDSSTSTRTSTCTRVRGGRGRRGGGSTVSS